MKTHSDPNPFDLAVFTQGTYWTDPDGHQHHISDLDAKDRASLASWLLRNAEHFYLRVLTQELLSHPGQTPTRVPDVVFAGADDWMKNTELMRSLTQMRSRPGPCSTKPQQGSLVTRRGGLARLLRR